MSCAMVYWGDRNFSAFKQVFARFGAVVSLKHLKTKARQPNSSAQGRLFMGQQSK